MTQRSTIDVAWYRYLQAEYAERQAINRDAPKAAALFEKERIAAAKALEKMGVEISTMRVERLEAAVELLTSRLAEAGIRATVRRAGREIVVESPDEVDVDAAGVRTWGKERGIQWASSTWPSREDRRTVLVFHLAVPHQDGFVREVTEECMSRPQLTDEENSARYSAQRAEEKALLAAGRETVGLVVAAPRFQRSSWERIEELIRQMRED